MNLLHFYYYLGTHVYIIIYIVYSYNHVRLKQKINEQSVAYTTTQYENTCVFDFNNCLHFSY